MPYLIAPQDLARPPIPSVPFSLPRQAQWRSGTVRVQAEVVNWPGFSVAVLESLEVTRFRREIGASIVRTLEFEIRALEQLYTFRGHIEVSRFLERCPVLIPLLLEAYGKIANYLGPYPQVFLKVVTDPEATDDRELVAFIRTNLPPAEALNRLEQLDEGWWLEASHRARGNLCIHVEFL